jgi:hypothetical protein
MIKKRFGIVLILIVISTITVGQTFIKSTEPFTAINGEVFNVGDKIIIATPADFSNIYTYYTQGKNLEIKKDAVGSVKIGNNITEYDNRLKYVIIKHFKINPELGTFAVVDGLFNVMVNINKAIETREIVSKKHWASLSNSSTLMTDSISYIRMLHQIDSVNIDNTKEFLYLFDNKIYNQIREDEFEFQEQITLTMNKLKTIAIDTQFNDTLKIMMKIDLGNYDFTQKGFPVLWDNKNGTQILNDRWEFMTPEDINKNRVKLTDLRLKFINTESFNLLPLNKEKANLFIKHRKDYNGNINRTVYMYVHLKIKSVEDIHNSIFKYDFLKGEIHLNSEIIKICFFEDQKSYNWLNNIE